MSRVEQVAANILVQLAQGTDPRLGHLDQAANRAGMPWLAARLEEVWVGQLGAPLLQFVTLETCVERLVHPAHIGHIGRAEGSRRKLDPQLALERLQQPGFQRRAERLDLFPGPWRNQQVKPPTPYE